MGSEAERQLQFNNHQENQRGKDAKEVVDRLMREEDKLRREHLDLVNSSSSSGSTEADPSLSDKEKMILMQQKKIAALDAANRRLLEELNRMTVTGNSTPTTTSSKVSVTTSPINVTSIN